MARKIKKLSKDIPFLQERLILKETKKFAYENNLYYDDMTENMILNAMIEFQRIKQPNYEHIFTSTDIVSKLETLETTSRTS